LHYHGRNLRDPARATAKDVFSYLYNLQYYAFLWVATYWHFPDAVSVGDQLRRACQHVKSKLLEAPHYIHQNRTFEAECNSLIASATDIAADAVMKKFEKSLNDDLKKAGWYTSGGHV
jgi:hypothetical protein